MFVEIFLVGVSFGLLIYIITPKKKLDFPPGPPGIPVLGNLLQLTTEPYKQYMKWSKEYGPIFSLKLGNYDAIVLNTHKDIKDALAENALSGRPNFKPILDRSGGVPRGLLFNVERPWTEQRRFALKTLRDFGFGKKSMESMVQDEINELLDSLKKTAGQPMQTENKFNAAVINALWQMVTGQRYSHDDPVLQGLIQRLTSSIKQGTISALFNFFPVLYLLRSKFKVFFKSAQARAESLSKNKDFVSAAVKEHQASFQPDAEPRDFIDCYLKEMAKTTDQTSSFYKDEGLKNLTITLLDLFVAGAETTSTTLSWEFLLLAMHPDKQEKLHEEIKSVVGLSRLPSLNDRPQMPYTEAVINEVMRYSSMVPLSGTHAAIEDATFRGYKIPKGTLVIPNLYAVMHDDQVWGDPDTFRPERFLSEDGNTLLKNDAYMPFSSGKRICLGMTLAQDELFLFTTSLFQRFKVGPDPNGEPLKVEFYKAAVLVPKPQDMILQERTEG